MPILQHANHIVPTLSSVIHILRIIHSEAKKIEKEYGVRDLILTTMVSDLIALLKEIISQA